MSAVFLNGASSIWTCGGRKTPGRGLATFLNGASAIWVYGVGKTPGRVLTDSLNGASSIWNCPSEALRSQPSQDVEGTLRPRMTKIDANSRRVRDDYSLKWYLRV